MEADAELKYLEHAIPARAPDSVRLSAALRLTSRIIPRLLLSLLVAMIVGAVVFYGHAGLGDNTIEAEHRIAIRAGIEKFHLVQAGGDIDPAALLLLEQFSGVKKLKWETEPEPEQIGRELQSVLDDNGRILGWLSWDAERPMTAAAARFLPLFVGISFSLIALAFLFLWHARRIAEELAGIEQRMRELAHQDPLTGLPNGPRTMQFLEQALATRAADEIVTCCYLDLAGFRELSDSIGLPWCNELVRVIALKLGEVLPPEATIGRLGRHRFVFVSRTGSPEAGFSLAQEASKAISNPLWIHGQVAQIGANIGVAHAPRDGLTSDELFRHATLAMRAAKRAGRGTIMAFEPPMETDLQERRFLERELKRALDEESLELHYQPIVSAQGAQIVGVEALLRWTHPTRGNIPPMAFVPVAEQCGMMARLGEFVLYRALNDAKRWPNLYIAVNLSPIQVKDRALYALVSSMLAETGVEPSRVVLEITEGVLIDNPEETRKRLEELRELGVRIALDDFGSGYSSLRYLQYFPFDKLKIDSAFVTPLGRSANSGVIIQAIVTLGHALNLSVLVEGVETEEQRVLLRLAGCDEMQGYLFAKPAPRDTIDKLLLDAKLRNARNAQAGAVRAS